MRRLALLLPVLFAAACTSGPQIVYDKQGVTASRFANDYNTCVASAERQAPVLFQNQTNYGATISVGTGSSSRYWYGSGSGLGLSVDTRRIDVNEGRRIGLMQDCMGRKGYTPKQIPSCTSQQRSGAAISANYRQPPVTPESCAARVDGIGPVILTP